MPGFFVANMTVDIALKNVYSDNCVEQSIVWGNTTILRNTLCKFMKDKEFSGNDAYIVITEGYLLNKKRLYDEYDVTELFDLVCAMYERDGESFFKKFRGSFSGVLYVKSDKKWIVYTNHMGDSAVYYLYRQGVFLAGSQVNYLIDAAKKLKLNLTVNEQAAYQMLTYAFMADDNTYANEIKRLHGGNYIVVTDSKIEVKEYHRFHKHLERFHGKSEDEILDVLDKNFRNAVTLEIEKDREYGYKHLYDMSGGLDSRMGAWVAHHIANIHMQYLTYCKANYMDEIIAKEVAAYWKDEILVKPLDDISFMYDIDDVVFMLNGASLYTGITGGNRFLKSLNMTEFGLEHTGMLGDVIIGSYYHSRDTAKDLKLTGRYSDKLSDRLKENGEHRYDDHELYLLYTRGFHGIMSSYLIRKNYTEPSSPFCDVDFFQLCMDIPVELRKNHKIYRKWILDKYPEAADFKWESINGKIKTPQVFNIIKTLITKTPQKIWSVINQKYISKDGMNPLDYWYTNDSNIQHYFAMYKKEQMDYIPNSVSEKLINDINWLFDNGNLLEKSMVLTLLASFKLFFGDEM